ncbi:MAG: hypothetical protein ACOC0O_03250 [Spirochaetota bacterium]
MKLASHCVLVGGRIVPLVEAGTLDQVRTDGDLSSHDEDSPADAARGERRPFEGGALIAEVAGRRFALLQCDRERDVRTTGEVAVAAWPGDRFRNAAIWDGRAVPVIDLVDRPGTGASVAPPQPSLLIRVSSDGAELVLAADRMEPIDARREQIVGLTPLLSSRSVDHALVHDGRIIPITDPARLLAEDGVREVCTYSLDERFNDSFLKTDVDVVEFAFGEFVYALPHDLSTAVTSTGATSG